MLLQARLQPASLTAAAIAISAQEVRLAAVQHLYCVSMKHSTAAAATKPVTAAKTEVVLEML